MSGKISPSLVATACGLILGTQLSVAQTSTQIFSAVDTRTSQTAAAYATPNYFNTATLSLTCGTAPITASLSGPLMLPDGSGPQLTAPPANALQAGGNLLVDNNFLVTVGSGTPTDICTGYPQGDTYNNLPVPTDLQENCFQLPYASAVGYPTMPSPLTGDDPDTTPGIGFGVQTVDFVGGVAPIDISGLLASGQQNVTFTEVDDGGYLTASSIFLTTNCAVAGVAGPATVTGNTITTGNSATLTQSFNFNTVSGQQVGFVYDLGGVSIFSQNNNDAIPNTADAPLDPATFQPYYTPGTSFATSNCLIHTGELLPGGGSACKLYTLTCTIGTGNTATGAQCPVSVVANEVVQDLFDGPAFTLQNIYTPFGNNHEGIGLLMASDTWGGNTLPPAIPTNGGPCEFDLNAGPVATLPCPLNLLTSFSGPGGFGGVGQTTNPNSTFISVYGVPEDNTSVLIGGTWLLDQWVNTSSPKVYFYSQTPNFTKGASIQQGNKLVSLPNYKKYVPAPIASITYGVYPANSSPTPTTVLTTPDNVVSSGAPCTYPLPTQTTEPNFAPPVQTLAYLPDGQYLLHYYATDCAGTRELLFSTVPSNQGPSWTTNFYTVPLNIDTQNPTVTFASNSQLVQGGSYTKGSAVTATYTCTDPNSVVNHLNTGSGLVLCGTNVYSPETKYTAGPLTVKVNTTSKGSQTFTVNAIDGAGNTASKTITYTVH